MLSERKNINDTVSILSWFIKSENINLKLTEMKHKTAGF